jgi:hypothetical protein
MVVCIGHHRRVERPIAVALEEQGLPRLSHGDDEVDLAVAVEVLGENAICEDARQQRVDGRRGLECAVAVAEHDDDKPLLTRASAEVIEKGDREIELAVAVEVGLGEPDRSGTVVRRHERRRRRLFERERRLRRSDGEKRDE